ncbi:Ohr family peroxiredoxin [Edaphosphingomonas haloaromaticamans]|uniref:Organic hydroperoxide resistance protein OhrB n=1 Tax=Edaphosphingomonas haloaromaticamans TaxID=653954 RepID=A0A1S1HCG4_9SPHN|nr:Ohr family peroxiredoxin [Sphingomonas haloaromaticamans]OHT19141.1 Organic hydroperoxide resistance protein OhrB [Sphingomonas haloaromaticamans]
MIEKVLFTGRTHTSGGHDGITRSSDGFLDIRLPEPHPAAEQLFGAAWSACYIGAIGVAAAERKIALPADLAVDAQIELARNGGGFFLRARLDVSLPGIDRAVARELADAAHGICPYSKAVHGNIDVATNIL